MKIGFERRRIHCHQHIGGVARGHDVVVGEVQLEGRDARQSSGRCPNLSGEVREGRKVIAHPGGFGGEPVTGQLHAIAGVTSKADYDPAELHNLLAHVASPESSDPNGDLIVPCQWARRSHG